MRSGLTQIRRRDSYETRWIVVGDLGAIDFHCSNSEALSGLGRVGGVEIHNRQPFDYAASDKASHEHCWILDGPCWHDGSSLYASEVWIPLLESSGEDAIWRRLESEYRRRFVPEPVES